MAKQTNQQIVESYDTAADTLYVSFGTGEPSYAEEIDDVFVVEMGMFSHLPTGFRVINFSKHKVKAILASIKKVIKDRVRHQQKEISQHIRERAQQLEEGVNSTFAAA
jgi:uncharacterized protein YuzE